MGAMFSVAAVGVAAAAPVEPEAHTLLDVPYLPQTPELCGGAAVAMVLRYWGERDVFPQDFESLISPGDGGILTATLTAAVRDRRWLALVVPAARGTARARIQSEIDRGRPLIALIEVAPRTYHYVVIVGLTDGDVVLHDPARAPFRVLRWAEFERAWEATDRWMMLALPPVGFRPDDDDEVPQTTPASSGVEVRDAGTPCSALVGRGVHLALTGEREWERQTYAAVPASGAAVVRGARRRVGVHLADWSASWLRWQTGAALDRLSVDDDRDEGPVDTRDHLAVDGSSMRASACACGAPVPVARCGSTSRTACRRRNRDLGRLAPDVALVSAPRTCCLEHLHRRRPCDRD